MPTRDYYIHSYVITRGGGGLIEFIPPTLDENSLKKTKKMTGAIVNNFWTVVIFFGFENFGGFSDISLLFKVDLR